MSHHPLVSIVGFGAFGQLIARHLRGHARLHICDPVRRGNDLAQVSLRDAARANIVVLAVPVPALEQVLHDLAPHLRPGTVVIDVASVKERPARLMQDILPPDVDIIASHPLFGPASAADGLAGHRLAWCPLRGMAHRRIGAFLRRAGLRVITTTPAQHDRDMAVVQGLTHLIARSLARLGPAPRRLTTRSFDALIHAAAMVQDDSPELLHTILTLNPHAEPIRRAFLDAANRVVQQAG
ncbi:prephenate dehydrogenase/arogenate dehydrogenase family protein [Paracoccus sp. (in: a-proteobacteria)]|uniref:prephenate dehydrogenase/arogenate dehydrogenase family protein n=1 Tax=Paracoccus sp. TaxID=267 RepID=UPI0026E0EC2E|nr:prephenate dehydrogenase/arogenate dehydrogenase family protein [Paracoccus sp. (in: a-proteobacteria)]MDO5647901.1 prephenate dehydrogenase/arogenate dehydrogenase family protein [Paracoccus sp. (in: a-proteobacteria)]